MSHAPRPAVPRPAVPRPAVFRSALLAAAVAGAAAVAVVLPAPAGAALPAECVRADLTVTCSYSYYGATTGDGGQVDGAEQTFTVPAGVSQLALAAVGASGGADGIDTGRPFGGTGGAANIVATVTPGQVLNVEVGGTGMGSGPELPRGGFNGGGSGGTANTSTVLPAEGRRMCGPCPALLP
jgi:hypothetical protein